MKFGIIGTNKITDLFIEAGRQHEEFELTSVYSRTEERAKDYAEKHGIPHRYTDLGAMLESADVDAVYIASPNFLHAEQAIRCMEHGKHVLCEKPLASNAAEVRRMVEASRANKVVLMEALKTTLLPNFAAVQQNLHKLGPIRRLFASYCQYSSRYDAYKEGTVLNAFNPEYSNGSLMDIGVYCVYPAVVLFGKPQSVKAAGVMLESGVDGEGSLLLQYESMDAVLMHSKITNSNLPSEIQGEHGNMIIHQLSVAAKVEIQYRDGRVEDLSQPQQENTMVYEVEEFIRVAKSGRLESDVNSHADSLAAMSIMDEARRQLGLVYPADQGSQP
ncbi:Gfo/Idh/MocA family protein [Paenibacillus sp. GCM10023252]|uniref:Gfo/Idh/MocA family protein n=1 Tax=Paenibacillus sp. GCM10023252 TaxID=3252649 RepID=UPI0036233C64